MVTSFKTLEKFSLIAPLGLRFWDEVTAKPIGDGLKIEACPASQPYRKVAAFVNQSSIYILRDLPGLRDLEQGFEEQGFLDDTLQKRAFVIEVEDLEGRFQPFRFTIQAPLRGIYVGEDLLAGSPPHRPLGIPLFSTARRSVPALLAVVRADLFDSQNQRPAAWALLEAWLNGALLGRGLADGAGRVAVIFPYPELQLNALGSPPNAAVLSPPFAGPTLKEQRWLIELKAFYQPQTSIETTPDLHAVLTQPPATLWKQENQLELEEVVLSFGEELILKSPGSPSSTLLVTPLRSPP